MSKNKLVEKFKIGLYFLVDEFKFDFGIEEDTEWGCRLVGKNKTTGIHVIYELREAFVNVVLFQLENNQIKDNINKAIRSNEKMLGFSLEHIISFKNPNESINLVYPSKIDLSLNTDLDTFLFDLKLKIIKYSSEILLGDFSLFDQLEVEVRKKYKDYYLSRENNLMN